MPEIVLATRNRHKIEEIVAAFDLAGVTFSLLDSYSDIPEVVEDGETFEANARKKAAAVRDATGQAALADDSGLCVDALDGAPGVRSARFSGPGATDASNRRLLVERMSAVEGKRQAHFACVLALALPDGAMHTVEGRCEGSIVLEERGSEGFGYDPLFVPADHERTFAEMTQAEKAELSHRGRALKRMARVMSELFPASAGRRS